jgi:hypothetical protein
MATATAPARSKDVFENQSGGYCGVVTISATGEEKALPVAPGQRIALSRDEQVLTANGPRDPADNVLANGTLQLVAEAQDLESLRPLRPEAPDVLNAEAPGVKPAEEEVAEEVDDETGAAPAPVGPPPVVPQRPPGEEGQATTRPKPKRPAKPAGS